MLSKYDQTATAIIKAPRKAVYDACLDPQAVASWRVPDNMTARFDVFNPREGGTYRITLTYKDEKDRPAGKTTDTTDTFQGRFTEIVPYEKIVEVVEFESADPRFAGEMQITTTFTDTPEGTEVAMLFHDIPSGIPPEDNVEGVNQSLRKLATFVENPQ